MKHPSIISTDPEFSGKETKCANAADLLGGANGKHRNHAVIQAEWKQQYRRLIQLRTHLLTDRAELVKEAREETSTFSMHMADAATDSFDRDFALSHLSADQDVLYEIDEAIKRIENGTYGLCELTGKPIARLRLEAIPWTWFCMAAELQLEKDGAVPLNRLRPLGSVKSSSLEESEEGEPAEEKRSGELDETVAKIAANKLRGL